MFKKIITIFIVCISLLSLTSCNKGSKKVDDFPEFVSNLESYKVTGKLYSVFPTGTKESLITVYFQKPEMYRVEIDNETNGDKQIIFRKTDSALKSRCLCFSLNKHHIDVFT